MHEANAILAISSTDRFTTYSAGNANQPITNKLIAQYSGNGPPANDFSITAPAALMNGYIEKIVISQIQLQYNLPTIVPGGNDLFTIKVESSPGTSSFILYNFNLPFGFFNPYGLSAALELFLNETVYGDQEAGKFTAGYQQGNPSIDIQVGFSVTLKDNGRRILFPSPSELKFSYGYTDLQVNQVLKTYRTFGFAVGNTFPSITQYSYATPELLYTPYIDIYSDALTNYQKLKDTDSSTTRRKGLIARMYISGVGNPQITSERTTYLLDIKNPNGDVVYEYQAVTDAGTSLGSHPFSLTFDLNNPKVVGWSRDTAINSLDFQVRDCYGDLLFNQLGSNIPGTESETFNTEFQMTLLCIEG
jgi:hypothetical protein